MDLILIMAFKCVFFHHLLKLSLMCPFKRREEGGVVARKATWLVGSLGEASGATDAAGNSITHTESGAGFTVEDLPVPSWSVRRWPCGDKMREGGWVGGGEGWERPLPRSMRLSRDPTSRCAKLNHLDGFSPQNVLSQFCLWRIWTNVRLSGPMWSHRGGTAGTRS